MADHCCVLGCSNNREVDKNIAMRKFPLKNEKRWETWVKLIGRPDILKENKDTSSYKVCEIHFAKSALEKKGLAIARKCFNKNEIPSLYLPIAVRNIGTQPEYDDKDGSDDKIKAGPYYIIPFKKRTAVKYKATQTKDTMSSTSYSPLKNVEIIDQQQQEYIVITDSKENPDYHVVKVSENSSSDFLMECIELPDLETSKPVLECFEIAELEDSLINSTIDAQTTDTQSQLDCLDQNTLKDIIMNSEPCLDQDESDYFDTDLVIKDSDIAELEKDLSTLAASTNFRFFDNNSELTTSLVKNLSVNKELPSEDLQELSYPKKIINDKRLPVDIDLTKGKSIREKKRSENNKLENTQVLSDHKSQLADFVYSVFKEEFVKIKEMLAETNTGHMFTKKLTLYCLNLYYKAPKAYKLFQNYFDLISERRLLNTKFNLGPSLNQNFIHLISKQLQDKPKNAKYVTLCLDEIPLSRRVYYDILNDQIIGYNDVNGMTKLEMANTALILRIKGCFMIYEQLICYVLSGNTYDCPNIIDWINDTLNLLFSIGFEVCAIVANQTPMMSYLAEIKGITCEKPFFTLDGKKIFLIFDVPQLMNSVRDNMLTYDFLYDESKLASWKHVKEFHKNQRSRRKISLAPKLTNKHIEPAVLDRTKSKLTKQVFSYTVAAGVAADIESKLLPKEAKGTADFLLKMNDLYDILSSTKAKNPHKYEIAFAAENFQNEYLWSAYSTLLNIKAYDVLTGEERTKLNCFLGLLTTIESVLELSEYFTTLGIKSIPTRRLHLNTEKLFSEFTSQSTPKGKSELLTPIQFKRCFRKLALKNLLNSPRKVTEDDLDSMILCTEAEYGKNDFSLLEEYFPKAPDSAPIAVGTTDYRTASTFKSISSYLLQKCLSVHTCDDLRKYSSENKRIVQKVLRDGAIKHTVIMVEIDPPQDFVEYMDKCEKCFVNSFDNFAFLKKVGTNLLEKFQELAPLKPCPCFPIDYLNKLFIRLRIYKTLKSRNKKLKLEAVK